MSSMVQKCGLLEQDMPISSSFLLKQILMLATKVCPVSLLNPTEKVFP